MGSLISGDVFSLVRVHQCLPFELSRTGLVYDVSPGTERNFVQLLKLNRSSRLTVGGITIIHYSTQLCRGSLLRKPFNYTLTNRSRSALNSCFHWCRTGIEMCMACGLDPSSKRSLNGFPVIYGSSWHWLNEDATNSFSSHSLSLFVGVGSNGSLLDIVRYCSNSLGKCILFHKNKGRWCWKIWFDNIEVFHFTYLRTMTGKIRGSFWISKPLVLTLFHKFWHFDTLTLWQFFYRNNVPMMSRFESVMPNILCFNVTR